MREAPPVDELRGEHHRRVHRDPAEALKPADGGLERGRQRERVDALIELVAALELVVEERQVLAEDELVLKRGGEVGAASCRSHAQVWLAPVGPVAIDEAAPGEDLRMCGATSRARAGRSRGTDDVATRSSASLGMRTRVSSPIDRVAPTARRRACVLPLHARLRGDARRRDDVAGIAPLAHRAVQHIARAARLVAGAQLAAVAREAVQIPRSLARSLESVSRASGPARRRGGPRP